MASIRTEPQIFRPKIEGGCEWGQPRKVLARLVRNGVIVKELWYQTGYSFWAGRGCSRDYMQASLMLAQPHDFASNHTQFGGARTRADRIVEGKRLSKKLITEQANVIDEFFGHAVSVQIDFRLTVIIEEP